MIKKIIKLYDDKLFVMGLSAILIASPYPILSGWLFSKVGIVGSFIYAVVTLAIMVGHGLFIATKLFPNFRLFDDKEN